MVRTTISIPQDLLDRLREMAADRRTSIAALVREALEQKATEHRKRPRSLGIGASGHSDTAHRTVDERLIVERLGEPKLATLDRRHFSLLRPRHVDVLGLLPEN